MKVDFCNYIFYVKENDFCDTKYALQNCNQNEKSALLSYESYVKADQTIDIFFMQEISLYSRNIIMLFYKNEVEKMIYVNKIIESISDYINMQYKAVYNLEEYDDCIKAVFYMYAENIYTEEIFSDDDLENLKEFINNTVEKYGIAPIDNIEKNCISNWKN